MTADVSTPSDQVNDDPRLQQELMRIIFGSVPIVLAAHFVNGSLIALVFSHAVPVPVVAGWWILLLFMIVVRGLTWIRFRQVETPGPRWMTIAIANAAWSGLIWGIASVVFYAYGDDTHRMVLGFIIGGMGAGSVTALAPSLLAFYLYLFPSVVPLTIQLALQGDYDHLAMACACMLYLLALTFLGRRVNGWLRESVGRRFENADLVLSLERRVEQRTAELNHVNKELHQDIADRLRAEAALAKYGERQAAIAGFGGLALSGIDLDVLFHRAVTLVRDLLNVAAAAVIEGITDEAQGQLRAQIGLNSLGLPTGFNAGMADHSGWPLTPDCPVPAFDGNLGSRPALYEAERSARVVIALRNCPFGVLTAIAATARVYTANDISFMQSIANVLAVAIERKRAEQNLQKLAMQDPLTGLPNRELLRSHLHQELARTKRSGTTLALLLIDLDNFKDINDTLGHPAGDRLLISVADRLRSGLRQSDASARLGGDEFALILSDLRSPSDAAVVAQKVVDQLSEPYRLDHHDLHVGASVGVTVSPNDGMDVDGLMRNADLALYRAKSEGGGTHCFYAEDMAKHVEARKTLERDLRRALDHNEFFLVYQPFFDLATRKAAGVEALLRWRHPGRGLLAPSEFIPIAEASGLIVPVGQWVLERVTDQMLEWRERGLPPLKIAANISLSQCRRGHLIGLLEEMATRTDGSLDWLELEVTEQLFVPAGAGDCDVTLRRSRNLGVTIALDDFGTGYSSLGRLRRLPVDKVKIDKGFIGEIGMGRDAEMIVRATIALAKGLGMEVTAEGVETEAQLRFLRDEGCSYAQGHHLSIALSGSAFVAMTRTTPIAMPPARRQRQP